MQTIKPNALKKSPLRILKTGLSLIPVLLLLAVTFQGCKTGGSEGGLTAGAVSVTEDSLMIPTYLVDPPNPMPRFYDGQAHQGVKRRIYPYPMDENMTRVKEERAYHIIYLENEYIRIGIMPGLGGRIYEAIDKTNNYKFFYRNDVIEPSMIGMLGFWISGGNALGFPHHHGANTVAPMDYTIEKKPDGSVTVWMAYTELFHRTRLYYGFTIYPHSSIVEMTARPANPTPAVHSFLFWANPSVHADTNYQVIFPPSVEYVTQHHKTEMTTWPIADRRYNRFDYAGMDISMWKNTGVPSSFFSWDPQEDFFGGYDHGKQAGTAWIGNHYICTGMKYWADGNNAAGRMINEGLTDTSGRYIELMAGAYTDNQPDYSWLQPYEMKQITMTWYPIRQLGGLKQANVNAALNLEIKDNGAISVRLNATRLYKGATVVLSYDDREISRKQIDISPALPCTLEVLVDGPVIKEKLVCTLTGSSGELLLEYRPAPPLHKPMPAPLSAPPGPAEVKTLEELYLHGLRLDQFHNASLSSMPYYEEALKRDPGDYRVNTQMGILCLEKKRYEDAEKFLQTAEDRITMRYTRPKDSEALYYLAITQRWLHKDEEAYANFYRATWNAGWHAPSFHQLAEMDCERGDFLAALDHVERALETNVNDIRAHGLRVTILRKLGRLDEAERCANQILEEDLLDYQARNERYLVRKQSGRDKLARAALADLEKIMQGRVQSYLELATSYSNCGFYEEAIGVLSRLEKEGCEFPMVYYYLGYFWSQLGDPEKAQHYFTEANSKPHLYCFPFRDESVEALQAAIQYNPDEAMAYYYLGNLYYEQQPAKAVSLWEQSRTLDSRFYIVQRNLALAAREQQNDQEHSVRLYEEAFSSNPQDQRLMYEYDMALEAGRVSPAERYEKIYRGNREVSAQRTSTLLREMDLLVFLGQYDQVVDLLNSSEFVESEGSRTLRDIYHNAYILRSLQASGTGDYQAAFGDMQAALDYPIGRWGSERRAQMYYLMGTYHEAAGNLAEAENNYRKAVGEVVEGTEFLYHKGLAYRKLGEPERSREQFTLLLEMVKEGSARSDAFRSFEAGSGSSAREARDFYMRGLAYLGLGRTGEARVQFERALELDPSHVWSKQMLDSK
jgi:tetratricopeptide (TPR) repeat protein